MSKLSRQETTPSHDRSVLIEWALTPGVGPLRFQRWLEWTTLAADSSLRDSHSNPRPRLKRSLIQELMNAEHRQPLAEKAMGLCHELGIELLVWGDADYPKRLAEIPDPPPLLFVDGDISSLDRPSIAIVGSRSPNRYGYRVTQELAAALSRLGWSIVSGLAHGIDGVAHSTAIAKEAETIAVMAAGHQHVYPRVHHDLARQITQQGAVISEHPPWVPVKAPQFPQRNRIISGLSVATLVSQATERSGALITARLANEQNRDVFAVPGDISEALSAGTHRLIQEGAKLVTSIDDVKSELGMADRSLQKMPSGGSFDSAIHAGGAEGEQAAGVAEPDLSQAEQVIWNGLADGPMAIEDLLRTTGTSITQLLVQIASLEAKSLVTRKAGNLIERH